MAVLQTSVVYSWVCVVRDRKVICSVTSLAVSSDVTIDASWNWNCAVLTSVGRSLRVLVRRSTDDLAKGVALEIIARSTSCALHSRDERIVFTSCALSVNGITGCTSRFVSVSNSIIWQTLCALQSWDKIELTLIALGDGSRTVCADLGDLVDVLRS